MLARLLLILLVAVFAVPSAAPAACHDGAKVAHTMPMRSDDSGPRAVPTHACLGCIPPSDWLSPQIAGPMLSPVVVRFAPPPALLVGTERTPDLRPPRRG